MNNRQNNYNYTARPNNSYGFNARHANQNQFLQNDRSGDNRARGHQQNNSYRSGNDTFSNYGSSGQQSMARNDRPGYYTSGYQGNKSQ